jgi:hypothetical protein
LVSLNPHSMRAPWCEHHAVMRFGLVVLALALLSGTAALAQPPKPVGGGDGAPACGKERWTVKTLQDRPIRSQARAASCRSSSREDERAAPAPSPCRRPRARSRPDSRADVRVVEPARCDPEAGRLLRPLLGEHQPRITQRGSRMASSSACARAIVEVLGEGEPNSTQAVTYEPERQVDACQSETRPPVVFPSKFG